mgnify:CR=1 FL=1
MSTIAEQLMTSSPPVVALRSEPFTIAEIDAHSDAGRIWATIEAMKAKAKSDMDEAEGGYSQDEVDNARAEGFCDAIINVDIRIRKLLQEHRGAISETLARKIKALTERL